MSSFPEFGKLVEESKKGEFPEFGTPVEEIPRWKSLVRSPVKGAIKEVGDIVELLQKVPLPKGPLRGEKIREFAEEKFTTREGEAEKLLERGGRLVPGALLGPGRLGVKAAQVAGGALLGHGAEKLGAPEVVQSVAEALPFLYAGGKKIPLKSSQKKFGEFLRKNGLDENEIAPLIKTPEQLERWSKYASKGDKSRRLLESIYEKTGNIYDSIIEKGRHFPPINDRTKIEVLNDFSKIIEGMPNKYREAIKHDLSDLLTKGRGGFEDLMNFYKDVNAVIGPEVGGRAIVGQFKEPLVKAMRSISPELAEDFQLANDLYRTRKNVSSHLLSKKDFDKFMDLGEHLALGAGVFNRDIGMITKVLGSVGARKIAREMLINPRLQNISLRIGESLRKNKFTLAEKYMHDFSKIISKDDPELGRSIESTMID